MNLPYKKMLFKIIISFFALFLIPGEILAISSPNFQIPYFDFGPGREIESGSPNFKMESFIGDPFRGNSANPNYREEHGFFYPEQGNVLVNLKALPEMRVPTTGNFDTHLTVEVRNPGQTSPLFSKTVDTDTNGLYSNILLTGINPGTYDITAKGYSHLRDKEQNAVLVAGANNVDFSNNDTNYLLAGDVNGTNGDNLVNSVDIAIEIIKLDQTSGIEKEDLNQDIIVNSIDLAITIKNLDLWGDF